MNSSRLCMDSMSGLEPEPDLELELEPDPELVPESEPEV